MKRMKDGRVDKLKDKEWVTYYLKKYKYYFIAGVSGFIIGLLLNGILSQSLYVLREDVEFTFSPLLLLYYAFFESNPLLWGISMVVPIFCLYVVWSRRKNIGFDEERKVEFSEEDKTYGDGHVLSDEELEGYIEKVDIHNTVEDIMGCDEKGNVYAVQPPPKGGFSRLPNEHMAICGTSGSKKSRAFGYNKILQAIRRGESFITTETSGELYGNTSKLAEKMGYTVRVLDARPSFTRFSDSINFLSQIVNGDPTKAMTLASVIIDNIEGQEGFWRSAQQNCLTALILLVDSIQGKSEKRSLPVVYDFLIKGDAYLERLFNSLPHNHPAKKTGMAFVGAEPKVKQGALHGLSIGLQILADDKVRNILTYDEIDLTKPGFEKCAYYIIISPIESTLRLISALFFNFVFVKLVDAASMLPEYRLPITVNVMMDEFTNIGKIMAMVEYISQVRKHGIRITILFQDVPQMKEKYGGESGEYWRSILSNCSINIILSCNENEITATHYSDLMGEATIKSIQKRVQRSALTPNSPRLTYMEGEMVAQRQAVLKTDIANLDSDQHYVHIQGLGPKKMYKYDYSRHFLSKQLEQVNIIDHRPAWWVYQPMYATENYSTREKYDIPNVSAPEENSDAPPQEFVKKDTDAIKKSLFPESRIKKGERILKSHGGKG